MPATPYIRNHFDSSDFTYDAAAKTFYAEASTLQWHSGNIVIQSKRTGAECEFAFVGHEQVDNENVAFRFAGKGAAEGCRAVIFND